MRKLLLISLMCFGFLASKAQFWNNDTVQMINGPFALEKYQKGFKLDFSFDSHNSFFDRKRVQVGGFRLGVQHRRVHRLGMGLYFLNNRIFDYTFDYPIAESVIEYQYGYATIYYERVVYLTKKWELAGVGHLGGGTVNVYYNPRGGNDRRRLEEIHFDMFSINAAATYNVFYWLGIGGGIGYRQFYNAPSEIKKTFSSPTYVFKVQFRVVKLARSIFDKSVKDEY